ncbi:MAG TPA: hypothetical protein VJU86_22975 [Pyrinomonadaceae bacterium]|nr:hypothetical protein [Pyrinomonadaceae bacterium]
MTFEEWGAFAFGFVIGWICYRTLRRKEGSTALSDIATVIGAVGGASVLALFKSQDLFSGYAIGLAVGFFLYLVVSFIIGGKDEVKGFMGGGDL